jgi:tetratricopeptide (TPR) repeat protein
VAKPTKPQFNNKMQTRTMGAPKGKRPDLRLNTAPSNEGADKQAQMIFIGASAFSVLLIGGLIFWAVSLVVAGYNGGHINWIPVVVGSLMIGAGMFLARTLAWLSYFAAIMYAMKANAWASQERLCRAALKHWKIFPGGASTAVMILVQSLVSRGEFDQAIEIGEQQWALHGEDPKFNESLSPMYASLGMAFQVKGQPKEAVVWTERGITAMERSLQNLVEKKTWQAKMAGIQGVEAVKQLKMQLCVAYFNNATSYFNQMNHRQARSLYKQALDYCNQSADFPEKADIMRVSKEQLSRLKHA